MYAKGGIPCRLRHGSVKNRVEWTVAIENLDYNPLFVTFMYGLGEEAHPFKFLVEAGLVDLINAPEARHKIMAMLSNIVSPLRIALGQRTKVY